ncbi:hypothetical protein [Streptomyces globisporus]|uniref:hypothetical protein n=1 Tax=Streptomyces globisporus TaxID=1908 RepID=UPI00386764B8|nr:hypothetical protein OG449_28970 [Streptomyces globisporus]
MTLSTHTWTITIGSPAGHPVLVCSGCALPVPTVGAATVSQIRRHLAVHLIDARLPPHLRTCRCREKSCAWHRRQGPCSGPLRLLLIRADCGRTWHLADACAACAGSILLAAIVPEPPESAIVPRGPMPAGEALADLTPEPGEWVEAL